MAQNKTVATTTKVSDFLATIVDEQQRKDSEAIVAMMRDITGEPPVMWGTSIIGFGTMHLTSAAGREIDWLQIGFSPRKGKLSLYVTFEAEKYKQQLDAMGKYKTGKGCIYLTKLADVDTTKLKQLIADAYQDSKQLAAK